MTGFRRSDLPEAFFVSGTRTPGHPEALCRGPCPRSSPAACRRQRRSRGGRSAGGFALSYDDALKTSSAARFGRWREFDPEDAIRFDVLRHREVGMIKSSPNQITAESADWRFLNALKRELKA